MTKALVLTQGTVSVIANTLAIPIEDVQAEFEHAANYGTRLYAVLEPRHENTRRDHTFMPEFDFHETYIATSRVSVTNFYWVKSI